MLQLAREVDVKCAFAFENSLQVVRYLLVVYLGVVLSGCGAAGLEDGAAPPPDLIVKPNPPGGGTSSGGHNSLDSWLIQASELTRSLHSQTGEDLKYQRSGEQVYRDELGVWRRNRIVNQPSFTGLGVLVEPSRTNFTRGDSAAAMLGPGGYEATGGLLIEKFPDAEGIARAGLQKVLIAGLVYRVVNSTGNTEYLNIPGNTGRLQAHAFSLFAQSRHGAVQARLIDTAEFAQNMAAALPKGEIPVPEVNEQNPYPRLISENITPCTGRELLQLVLAPGAEVRFILPQLEVGPNALNANVTSPIITRGAVATRGATRLTLSASQVPDNDYLVALEVTPTSMYQQGGAAHLVDIYADPSNRIRLLDKAVVNKISARTDAVSRYAFGKYSAQLNTTSALAMKVSSTEGVKSYADNALPNTTIAANEGTNLSAGIIGIGSAALGGEEFSGWVKNFRIYAGQFTDQQCLDITQIHTDIKKLPIKLGAPLQDNAHPNVFWALAGNDLVFNKIVRSDDYGETYTDVVKLQHLTREMPLQRDGHGNFYYSTTTTLQRISADFASERKIIEWNAALKLSPLVRNWSWLVWAWGVSREGWLFTAGYTLPDLGAQIFYVSKDQGLSWVPNRALDELRPLNRHIHAIAVNPQDNKLYVSVGDSPAQRANFVSNQPVGLWDGKTFIELSQSNDAKGATGLTFTGEGVYWGSDTVGNVNYVTRTALDTGEESRAIKLPANFDVTPVYGLRAMGDNQMVSVSYNEKNTAQGSGAVMLWQKNPGLLSPWQLRRLVAEEDANSTGFNYFALGHNGYSAIPAHSEYVFVSTLKWGSPFFGPTYRIRVPAPNF